MSRIFLPVKRNPLTGYFSTKMISMMITMMTSSNGNIFRVTGHLCGGFTGHRWIPCIKANDAELWCIFILFETQSRPLYRHSNEACGKGSDGFHHHVPLKTTLGIVFTKIDHPHGDWGKAWIRNVIHIEPWGVITCSNFNDCIANMPLTFEPRFIITFYWFWKLGSFYPCERLFLCRLWREW